MVMVSSRQKIETTSNCGLARYQLLRLLYWDGLQQGARFGDNTVLELWIAHECRALHRMATLVVVDAGLARCIDQDFGDHTRGSLRRAQNLDEGHEQWHEHRSDVCLQQTHESAGIARSETSGQL